MARQAREQRALIQFARARGMAAAMHQAGESQDFDGVMRVGWRGVREAVSAIEQRENLPGQRRQAPQVHLVMMENSGERFGGSAAQKIKIELRDQRGVDVVVARPFEGAASAAKTWRSSSLSRTEPRRRRQSWRAGCSRSRCAVGVAARILRVMR